jgi:hypothetical protein
LEVLVYLNKEGIMKKILSLMVAAFALIVFASGANALTIPFSTAPGSTELGGNPVSATAVFETSTNTVTLTVTNTLINPTTVAQNISDLFFKVSTGQTSGTLTSVSGTPINVAANGTFDIAFVGSTHWVLQFLNSGFYLNDLSGGQPEQTIIGATDASGVFSNANNSIAGNDPHNPFLSGPVTFILAIPGVDANSSITDVSFSFGTTAGNNVPGIPVPEPTSLLLIGLGLLGAAAFGRKLKK